MGSSRASEALLPIPEPLNRAKALGTRLNYASVRPEFFAKNFAVVESILCIWLWMYENCLHSLQFSPTCAARVTVWRTQIQSKEFRKGRVFSFLQNESNKVSYPFFNIVLAHRKYISYFFQNTRTSSEGPLSIQLQFLIRFLLRFSLSDACERIDMNDLNRCTITWTFITLSLVPIRRRKSYRKWQEKLQMDLQEEIGNPHWSEFNQPILKPEYLWDENRRQWHLCDLISYSRANVREKKGHCWCLSFPIDKQKLLDILLTCHQHMLV